MQEHSSKMSHYDVKKAYLPHTIDNEMVGRKVGRGQVGIAPHNKHPETLIRITGTRMFVAVLVYVCLNRSR